jgi:hypothetical protein
MAAYSPETATRNQHTFRTLPKIWEYKWEYKIAFSGIGSSSDATNVPCGSKQGPPPEKYTSEDRKTATGRILM